MKNFLYITVLILLSFVTNNASAALKLGEILPHTLKAPDQTGQEQHFETLTGEKGLVLVFVRSTDWCPYCQQQLLELNQARETIEALGYNVVSVSYDSVETLAEFNKKRDIGFTMLSDEMSEIIQAFGILNTQMQEGTKYYGIPYPAVYVIDPSKHVVGYFAEEGYKNRPPSTLIIEKLEELNQ